eukprot:gene16870-23141_t
MSKAAVVILCGGFGSDASNKPALALLNGKQSTRYVLASLEKAKRLKPMHSSVFWVVNESDKEAYLAGLLPDIAADYGFSEANFVSNGVTLSADWKGDVADLKTALGVIGSSVPVLAMSGTLTVAPGFNLQRMLEHTLIRGRNTVGFSRLGDADAALHGPQGHTEVQLADSVTAAAPQWPSASWRQPLLGNSHCRASAGADSSAGGLVELAAELYASGALNGIELGVGRLRLDNMPCLEYADQFLAWFAKEMQPCCCRNELDMDNYIETMGSVHQDFSVLFEDIPKLKDSISGFEKKLFGWPTADEDALLASGKSTMKVQYKLPRTFYMTTYRRQVAEIMR